MSRAAIGGRSRVARIPYFNSAPYFLEWGELERHSEGRWTSTVFVPRRLGEAAAAGELEAGLFAEADLARLEPEFLPLCSAEAGLPGGLGIANLDCVGSVLLFLRSDLLVRDRGELPARDGMEPARSAATPPDARPGTAPPPPPIAAPAPSPDAPGRTLAGAEAAALHGKVVAVTGDSSTSVRLLRLLLENRCGIRPERYLRFPASPRYSGGGVAGSGPPADPGARPAASVAASAGAEATREESEEAGTRLEAARAGAALSALDAAAVLAIGDEALRWRRIPPAGYALGLDLATGWHDWTGLPFVFARWGVRRTVPEAAREWLARFLARSLARAEDLLATEESFRSSPLFPADTSLGPPAHLRAFLRNFIYRLGPRELVAAERFRRHLRARRLLDPPIGAETDAGFARN